ncbi:hypothetical protein F5876DRAFT_71348, partial [Lentinula aff. lateritia]
MSTSRTQTHTTSSSTAGPSGHRRLVLPVNPTDPADPDSFEEEDLEEDEAEVLRKAQEKVRQMKERKAAAAAAAAAKQKAEEEAAKKVAEEAREQAAAREERRRRMAVAATARSRRGSSPEETSGSPRRPVVEIRREKSKGKGKSKAQVRCSYSNRPFTVKRDGGSNPTGEHLAVLESQVAQLLADNRQLRDGQVKANTYHQHFNRKLDWLITDAARRRRTPPELPEV